MEVGGFDWDDGNSEKCQKHGLTRLVIEEFFRRKIFVAPDIKHSTSEDRFLGIGLGPENRPLIVAFTFREMGDLNLIRPISARFMHKKEALKYAEAFKENEN